MATQGLPAPSYYVNDDGAYALSISPVPDDHLHRPLTVPVGDDTVLDETSPTDLAWCGWCEEPPSPTSLRHEGHDPERPLDEPGATLRPWRTEP